MSMLSTPLKVMPYQNLNDLFKGRELIVESSGKGERIGECIAEREFN